MPARMFSYRPKGHTRVKYYAGCKVNEYPFLTLKTLVKFPGNVHFDNGRAMVLKIDEAIYIYYRYIIYTLYFCTKFIAIYIIVS